MPTTRFASANEKHNTDMTEPINIESIQDSRKQAFNSRKKREIPADLSPKQNVMIQFIDCVIDADKHHLLWTRQTEQSTITIESVIEKTYKTKYKDFASLQSDLVSLCSSIVSLIRHFRSEIDSLQELYTFINNTLKLEASRFDEQLAEPDIIFDYVSLFRPAIDGYAFTDAIVKDANTGPIFNYPPSVQEVIVHPARPVEKSSIPTLKNVVAPPPKYHSKVHRHEDKPVVPVQWLDFGAFSSFAPSTDSNNANATYENTYMGRCAKRFKKLEQEQHDQPQPDTVENEKWLSNAGLDLKLLEAAIEKQQPDTVSKELERNSQLLEELVNYQNARFNASEKKWNDIDEKEIKAAKSLEKSISDMISKLPPNATLSSSSTIESAMTRLPLLESSYRGTLPPHKIFSFPTTEKAEVLPPYANITPTYAKENWRLIKVAPGPNKEGKQPAFPLISMVEQQQLNIYQKPAFPPQQQQQQQQQQRR